MCLKPDSPNESNFFFSENRTVRGRGPQVPCCNFSCSLGGHKPMLIEFYSNVSTPVTSAR